MTLALKMTANASKSRLKISTFFIIFQFGKHCIFIKLKGPKTAIFQMRFWGISSCFLVLYHKFNLVWLEKLNQKMYLIEFFKGWKFWPKFDQILTIFKAKFNQFALFKSFQKCQKWKIQPILYKRVVFSCVPIEFQLFLVHV